MPYTELHHRQRRREGGHGYDVLVGLCGSDHRWAHKYPLKAKEHGYVVDPHVEDVSTVPIRTIIGWVLFTKDGDTVLIDDN